MDFSNLVIGYSTETYFAQLSNGIKHIAWLKSD